MLKIVGYPADVLSRPAQDVVNFDDQLRMLVDSMAEVMYSSEGVGLAAPQVGLSQRLLLIDPTGGEEANGLVALINPRVTWRSLERELGQEGCLSLPGMVLQVPRSVAIDVEYYDVMGTLHAERCTGFKARVVQHEVDHLDGVMMLDQVGEFARRLALKGLGKNR